MSKFLAGLAFGVGFSLACLTVYTIWIVLVLPNMIETSLYSGISVQSEETLDSGLPFEEISIPKISTPKILHPMTPNFHELPTDEKIELATAILVVKFEEGDNGMYKSVVEEILKKSEGVNLYYNIGETFEENTYFEIKDEFRPNRAVVFFQGNPATRRFSTTFDGERIRGLEGISLALLRDKCNEA